MKPTKLRTEIFDNIRNSNTKFNHYDDYNLNNIMFLQPHSHRLTLKGTMAMSDAYTPYQFKNNIHFVKSNILLAIARNIHYPFYISNEMLILFSREDAFLLKLCGNDLEVWVNHIIEEKK